MTNQISIKKVSELKEGDLFTFTPRQKVRRFKKIIPLEGEGIPAQHRGMLLCVFSFNFACMQAVISPTTEVFCIG